MAATEQAVMDVDISALRSPAPSEVQQRWENWSPPTATNRGVVDKIESASKRRLAMVRAFDNEEYQGEDDEKKEKEEGEKEEEDYVVLTEADGKPEDWLGRRGNSREAARKQVEAWLKRTALVK